MRIIIGNKDVTLRCSICGGKVILCYFEDGSPSRLQCTGERDHFIEFMSGWKNIVLIPYNGETMRDFLGSE